MKNENLGRNGYKSFEKRADEYISDGEKAAELLENARKKAGKKRGSLSKIWEKVQLLFSLLDDWLHGRYKVIPTKSIVMIIVAVAYFVFPLDLLPDFIVGLGFVDDVAVLGFVIGQINKDLEDYRVWKETNSGGKSSVAEEEK